MTVNLDDQRTTSATPSPSRCAPTRATTASCSSRSRRPAHHANERLDYDTTAEGDDDLLAMRAKRGSYPRVVALTAAAHRAVCGMVQPTEGVDAWGCHASPALKAPRLGSS
jgi:hypothetical protein